MTGRGVAGSRGRSRRGARGGSSSNSGRSQGFRDSTSNGTHNVIRGEIAGSSYGEHAIGAEDYGSVREGLDGIHTREDGEISAVQLESQPSNASRSISHRKWIGITPDKEHFNDDGKATREIGPIVKNMYCGAWGSWKKVPIEHQDRMFERFKLLFQWEPEIEPFIRTLFNKICSKRLSEALSTARDEAFEKAMAAGVIVGDDYSIMCPYNPPWMRQQYWVMLVGELWNTDEWKKLSATAIKNRKCLTGGYHTTGSVGYDVCRRRLEKKVGRELEASESFTHAHARKGTRPLDQSGSGLELVYVDERARNHVEKYKGLLITKYGADNANHPLFDQESWDQCTGGMKKGRAYGSSTSSDPSYVLTGKPSTHSSSSSTSPCSTCQHPETQRLTQMLEEIQEERVRERESIQEERERERAEMREREEQLKRESRENSEALRREFNDKISGMMKFINYQPPSSPPPS